MRTRYLLTAAVLGGVVSFGWGSVSHMAAVLPGSEPQSFADSNAVIQMVHANAPHNGVLHIPSWVEHQAEALEDTLEMDVFSPIRQDWLDHTDDYFHK